MNRNLDIGILRTFVEVARAGSFTKATEKVFRTQSSVSLQIKRLEEELGKPLFFRNGRGVSLSAEGEILLVCAQKILKINDEVQIKLSEKLKDKAVTIGVHHEFSMANLMPVLARFRRMHPEVNLSIHAESASCLENKKCKGAYDIILTRCEETVEEPMLCSWKESLLWVGARHHPCVDDDPIPIILPAKDSLLRKRAIEALETANLRWQIVLQTPTVMGMQSAVEAGLGISILNRHSVPPSLQILPSPDMLPALSATTLAMFSGKEELSPAAEIVALCMQHCLDGGMTY